MPVADPPAGGAQIGADGPPAAGSRLFSALSSGGVARLRIIPRALTAVETTDCSIVPMRPLSSESCASSLYCCDRHELVPRVVQLKVICRRLSFIALLLSVIRTSCFVASQADLLLSHWL